jgi:Tfp pilus assembly protein PilF
LVWAHRGYQKCRGAKDRLVLPLSALSLVVGALVILTLSMRTIKQIGIWNNNITLWSYAIEQDPDNGLAYNQRGLHYGHEGEFENALEDFQKAAQFSPRDYNVRNNLGVTLHRLGKYVKAMEEYTISIEINPNNADAIGNRGLIYLKVGDVQSAVIDFQRSCELGLASSCKKLQICRIRKQSGQ